MTFRTNQPGGVPRASTTATEENGCLEFARTSPGPWSRQRSWPVVTSGPCRLHWLIRPIAAVVSRRRELSGNLFHRAAESVGDPHTKGVERAIAEYAARRAYPGLIPQR